MVAVFTSAAFAHGGETILLSGSYFFESDSALGIRHSIAAGAGYRSGGLLSVEATAVLGFNEAPSVISLDTQIRGAPDPLVYRALLMRRQLTHGCFIHAVEPEQQLAEVLGRLDLFRCTAPFSRCMECNGRLLVVEPYLVVPLVPKRVAELYTEFWRCGDCARIYWKGSHYRELSAFIERTEVALSKNN